MHRLVFLLLVTCNPVLGCLKFVHASSSSYDSDSSVEGKRIPQILEKMSPGESFSLERALQRKVSTSGDPFPVKVPSPTGDVFGNIVDMQNYVPPNNQQSEKTFYFIQPKHSDNDKILLDITQVQTADPSVIQQFEETGWIDKKKIKETLEKSDKKMLLKSSSSCTNFNLTLQVSASEEEV
jgi:hypothetical protein